MKLAMTKPYLSLSSLPEQTFESFVLITGKNGAGKSHLLKAIKSGAVTVDIAPTPADDIRLFDWNDLSPKDEGMFSGETIRQEQLGLFNHMSNPDQKRMWQQSLFNVGQQHGVKEDKLGEFSQIVSLRDAELLQYLPIDANLPVLRSALDQLTQLMLQQCCHMLQPSQRDQILSASEAGGRHIFALRQSDFLGTAKPVWGTNEIFQQSFARLFVAYRDLYLLNRIAQVARSEGDSDAPALTDSEFHNLYGLPPWDFVNKTLEAADLGFAINAPDRFNLNPYQPRLRKKAVNVEIQFSELSSGERVLMSFAFALYYANDSRQTVKRPKLLLLDEVDAPLHPAMVKSLLSTIQQVLIKESGLAVIMTTHSPTTIALAPDESIHVMRSGIPGIIKIDKDVALADLTFGVPTLSVLYDGRRQVFVESPKDVEIYQSAYDALRRYVASDILLNFIATGMETPDGQHVNTGCTVVKKIVADLRSAGAKHTFGLIDWDGCNQSGGGVFVLAEKERNGLESVLLDPLLLLNALVRQNSVHVTEVSLPVGTTYISLSNIDQVKLQVAIDAVQSKVLARECAECDEVLYVGGLKLLIDREYLHLDDHRLEAQVLMAFPRLNEIAKKRPGNLPKWIARTVLGDRPDHAPVCLIETFKRFVELL